MLIGSSEVIESDHSVHSKKQHGQSKVVKYYGFMTVITNNLLNQIYKLFIERAGRHHRSHNFIITAMRRLETKIEHFLDSFNKSNKYRHHLCHHRYNCFIYSIVGFLQRFLAGFFLQAGIKCLGSLGKIMKNPKVLLKILKNPVNAQLGMFLGVFVAVFRVSSIYTIKI